MGELDILVFVFFLCEIWWERNSDVWNEVYAQVLFNAKKGGKIVIC